MSFRSRLLIGIALAATIPLGLMLYGVHREMTRRLSSQVDSQVAGAVASVQSQLGQQGRTTRERLRSMAADLGGDNRFRLAELAGDTVARAWLLDWGSQNMRASGFAVLELQDSTGRVISSGHFRNQFDQVAPLASATLKGTVLVRAATPDSTVLALASVDSFRVADRLFQLTGGRGIDSASLAGLSSTSGISARLYLPGDSKPDASEIAGSVRFPFVDLSRVRVTDGPDSADIAMLRDLGPLVELRRSVDRWFLVALVITILTTLVIAAWLSARMSRPLALLAEKTAQVDLDRLDQDFATERDDEVGSLSRLLDAMTQRLRGSAMRLREAERRAAVGDLARQINHDVKNGLAPIRHVLRHLGQVAEREPENLAGIFKERSATLDSSIEYLDTLARNYARLSPTLDRGRSDVNGIMREIAQAIPAGAIRVETRFASTLPPVQSDSIVLRRILENLVTNGLDAMLGQAGTLGMLSEPVAGPPPRVRICVSDSGRGMSREELNRAFDDFYTTKDGGTGLGLSVVRRLVSDLGGTLRVETVLGQGSRFIVELPAAPGGETV
ncbi:MAG: HAMP domain-containing sensor histidine kinase [Gemmatimonadota bacterium]